MPADAMAQAVMCRLHVAPSFWLMQVSHCACNEKRVPCTHGRTCRRDMTGKGSGLSNVSCGSFAEAERSMQVVWIEEKEEVGLGGRCDGAADAAEVGHGIQYHAWARARQDTGARDHISN